MNDMTAITFSQNFLPWAAGETAWFSAAEAAVLVGKGVATDASSGSFAPNAALLAANPALDGEMYVGGIARSEGGF